MVGVKQLDAATRAVVLAELGGEGLGAVAGGSTGGGGSGRARPQLVRPALKTTPYNLK
jgi:hypothetical protein